MNNIPTRQEREQLMANVPIYRANEKAKNYTRRAEKCNENIRWMLRDGSLRNTSCSPHLSEEYLAALNREGIQTVRYASGNWGVHW